VSGPLRGRWPDEVDAGTPVIDLAPEYAVDVRLFGFGWDALDVFVLRSAGEPTRGSYHVTTRGQAPVYLVRDPDNFHDANAIEIWAPGLCSLGFVARAHAAFLAPALDSLLMNSTGSLGAQPALRAALRFTANWYYVEPVEGGPGDLALSDVDATLLAGTSGTATIATRPERRSHYADPDAERPSDGALLPLGWYSDPDDEDGASWRLWDGSEWTDRTEPRT
jgi:hypothetical protein